MPAICRDDIAISMNGLSRCETTHATRLPADPPIPHRAIIPYTRDFDLSMRAGEAFQLGMQSGNHTVNVFLHTDPVNPNPDNPFRGDSIEQEDRRD